MEGLPPEDISREPTASAIPPEGVEIPVETPYGDNAPVKPPEMDATAATPEATPAPAAATSPAAEESGGNRIQIPLPLFLILFLGLLGAAFYGGQKTAPVVKVPVEPGITQTNPETGETQKKTSVNMIPDAGLYTRRPNSTWNRVAQLLPRTNQQIIAVTGNPNHPKLLQLLREHKNKTGIPVMILVGKDTPKAQTKAASQSGLPIYRLQSTLEQPYTILLLDNRAVVDASRENWYWETVDPNVIERCKRWAVAILEEAELEH